MRPHLALGVTAALFCCSAAVAAGPVSYPASMAPADIAAWLRRDTPLLPSQVVDVAPSAVTAIMSSQPTSDPRGFIAVLHAEAVDTAIPSEEGIASWSIPVELDCAKRRVRLGPMTGYPGRDLSQSPRHIRDADNDWVAPAARAPLDSVLRALCDARFKRPLTDLPRAATLAQTTPPAAPPAPKATRPKPEPAAAPRRPPSGAVATKVQIGASPEEAEIKALIVRVQKKFDLGGLQAEAAHATVDHKTVYRGLISGFQAPSDASALCQRLKAGGQACFVRN